MEDRRETGDPGDKGGQNPAQNTPVKGIQPDLFAESGALHRVSSSVSIINPPAKQAAIQVAATAADKE